MKDPLQTQPTPYEVLGIDRSATLADIDRAFKAGLAKRVNHPSKLTGAKRVLERPVDRALLDLFQYDPQVLGRLRPDPRSDPDCLTRRGREATAEAWEAQLRDSFPDYGIAHALAVLWYWSALDASERLTGEGVATGDPTRPFDPLWEGAIAYWAMLQSSDDFWNTQTTVPKDVVPEVRRVLSERLPGDLQRFAQQHRDAGQVELADRYRRLELMLATEVKTAKALAGAGYRTSTGALWCGALMLGRLGLLDSIREQVDADLAASPRDETLQSLARALSPHFRIAALIERKEPQAALDAIAALPPGAKRTKEVKELKARALLLRGGQEASLGRTREALKLWKEASGCGPPPELAGKTRELASDAALGRAAALQSHDRDEAISILDLAVSFAATEKLNQTLGELLTERGVQTVVKGQKAFEKDPSSGGAVKLTKAIEKGLKDLERGAELGSARGKEQAEVARGLLGQLTGGMTPEVRRLLEEASKAAARGDLDTSVRKLRDALGAAPPGARAEVSKMLSAALSAHAVSVVNSTMEAAAKLGRETVAERFQDAAMELVEAYQLDSDNKHAHTNLDSLLEMMAKLDLPVVPGGAPASAAKAPAPSRSAQRGDFHAVLVGAAYLIAAFLGLMALPVEAFRDPDRLTGWVRAVLQASPVSPVLLGLAYTFLIVGVTLVIVVTLDMKRYWPTIRDLCATRWSKKHVATKPLEVALYGFLLAFALTAVSYERTLRPAEVASEQAPAAETPMAEAAAEAPESEAATPVAAAPETATPEPVPPASEASEAAPAADSPVLSDLSWMAHDPVPLGTVTALLHGTLALADDERELALARFDSAGAGAAESVRATLTLLRAAVAEERGDVGVARSGYHQLLTIGGGGPYAGTASLRLEVLEARERGALDEALRSRLEEAGDTVWARTREGWTVATAPRAALLALMDLRSDRLTVRFYRFLAEHSFAEPHAAYLGVYSFILILWTLVQLPVLFRIADLIVAAPKLAPQVARFQALHKGDKAALAKKLSELHTLHGVNPAWGCLHGFIDVAFVVLFYFTFRAYAPQLVLDGADFYGVADLLHRDLLVLGMWAFMGLLHTATQPNASGAGMAQVWARALLGVVMASAVAWLLHWPAWFLIFWSLLWFWSLCFRAVAVWLQKKRA